MNEQMLDDLIAFVRADRRVCPEPRRWNELWEMLPGRRRVGAGWQPPLPLILGGWWATSNLAKMLRLEEHLRYAAEHGALESVDSYLRGLPEGEWHHLSD